MLDKNILVRDTIRMFLAEVQKFEIDSKEVADDAKVLQIINKMIKQRNDSIEQFTKATGIKKIADIIPGGCGCDKRKDWFNKNFPYKK